MTTVAASRVIQAPIERVWDVFTDIPAAVDRISGITRIEALTQEAFGIGYRWRETRRMFGKDATEEMWVTGISPMASYEVMADSHGTKYLTRYDFTESPSGTEVAFTFTGEPHSLLAKVMDTTMGWMMKGTLRKQLAADLDDLAAACEQG